MRLPAWIVVIVGIAAGASVVLVVQNLNGTAGGDPLAAAGAPGGDPGVMQRNIQRPQPDDPVVDPAPGAASSTDPPAPPVETTDPEAANVWHSEFQRSSAQYAQTFQPGVWGMEPIPEFAVGAFQREGRGSDVISSHQQHIADIRDGWSAEMEGRLRNFFEGQEEISKARVAIDCRSTGCELQMTNGPLSLEERRANPSQVSTVTRATIALVATQDAP